nr:MAG TPA: hypothetical protein [Caudoviricetes sp.]
MLRGSNSRNGDQVGAFYVNLNSDASLSWWNSSADLSLAAILADCRRPIQRDRDALALAKNWPIRQP